MADHPNLKANPDPRHGSREVLASEGSEPLPPGHEIARSTFQDDLATVMPGTWAEIDDPVGVCHDGLVVGDRDARLAGINELPLRYTSARTPVSSRQAADRPASLTRSAPCRR